MNIHACDLFSDIMLAIVYVKDKETEQNQFYAIQNFVRPCCLDNDAVRISAFHTNEAFHYLNG